MNNEATPAEAVQSVIAQFRTRGYGERSARFDAADATKCGRTPDEALAWLVYTYIEYGRDFDNEATIDALFDSIEEAELVVEAWTTPRPSAPG